MIASAIPTSGGERDVIAAATPCWPAISAAEARLQAGARDACMQPGRNTQAAMAEERIVRGSRGAVATGSKRIEETLVSTDSTLSTRHRENKMATRGRAAPTMTTSVPAEPPSRRVARAAAHRQLSPRPSVARPSGAPTSRARQWRAVLVATSLPAVLAACATRVATPALPETHPAHPAAAATEPIRPSDLLERAAPVPAVEPAVLESRDHHAHGMAESAPPGQPAAGPGAEEHEDGHEAGEHEGHEQPPAEHEMHEPDAEEHEHYHDPDSPPHGPAG